MSSSEYLVMAVNEGRWEIVKSQLAYVRPP